MKRIADRTLIIPTIRLRDGRCCQVPVGEPGTEAAYPSDPAEQAVLWRHENMKMLHVIAEESAECTLEQQVPLLQRIINAVEISIQVEAQFMSDMDFVLLFEQTGAYRAVLDENLSANLDRVAHLIGRFGPRKIVPSLRIRHEATTADRGPQEDESALLRQAEQLAACGVERIVMDARQISSGPPIHSLLSLVERANLSVTLNGSVRGFQDLKLLYPLRDKRIDSIIMENALYSNAFPCQKIWRQAEQQLVVRNEPL
ncbi:MAG: HisA/HisF-related TIM barrel protein [Bacteroidia bacterium]|nr:HisA/HisF-related TIM barrel protein [Bacteroidia bacterium]